MFARPALLLVAVSAMVCSVDAATPPAEPDDALVSRLLNLKSRNRTPGIEVAMILEGTLKAGPFETANARRAITVHTIIDEGRQVRRVQTYDLHWTPVYGWFIWETRDDPGGEAVWIWSERLGETVVR